MISKEDFQKLQPFEDDFRRAVKAGYHLPTRKEENDIVVGVLLKYEPSTPVNWSCGQCVFNIYKRCGWLYYQYKEWLEKNPPKEVVEEPQEPEIKKLKVRIHKKKEQ